MNETQVKSILEGMSPEAQSAVTDQAQKIQKGLINAFSMQARDKSRFVLVQVKDIHGVLMFLNQNREKILTWSVVPDFQTYSYVLIYEEIQNG